MAGVSINTLPFPEAIPASAISVSYRSVNVKLMEGVSFSANTSILYPNETKISSDFKILLIVSVRCIIPPRKSFYFRGESLFQLITNRHNTA